MNITSLKESWNKLKHKIKRKFTIVTDCDLMFSDRREGETYD